MPFNVKNIGASKELLLVFDKKMNQSLQCSCHDNVCHKGMINMTQIRRSKKLQEFLF